MDVYDRESYVLINNLIMYINIYIDEDLLHILRATKDVPDWFTLGVYLKVEYSKLKMLRETFPSNPKHCQQEMFMSWISSGKATWRTLVNVLRNDMCEPALAEEIEKKMN